MFQTGFSPSSGGWYCTHGNTYRLCWLFASTQSA